MALLDYGHSFFDGGEELRVLVVDGFAICSGSLLWHSAMALFSGDSKHVTFSVRKTRFQAILYGMAKIYNKTIENGASEEAGRVKIGDTVYMLTKEDFETIVKENIKAQEANLNLMKAIAGSLFGYTL